MAVIEIDISREGDFERILATLGERGMAVVRRAQEKRFKEAVTWARANRLSGRPGLIPRSGDLRHSFWYEITLVGREIVARLGFIRGPSGIRGAGAISPLKYAWVHEFGKVIRAKAGGYLRVPTEAVLTPAGRYKAKYNVVSARTLSNTAIWRSRGGSLGIYEVHRGRPPVRLFHLVDQVEIPARPTLRPTWFIVKPLLLMDIRQGLAALLQGRMP
jgi:hypothetical protein